MARPKKDGLDYFPVDVYFDEKVQSIEMMHGNDGITWVIKFWQKAYKTMTGLVDLRGLFGELFSKNCRITLEKHSEILNTAVSVEFCYEYETGVYTSEGIQRRISSVSSDRKAAIERQNSDKEKKRKVKVKESKVKDCPDYSANNSGTIKTKKEVFESEVNTFLEYSEEMRANFLRYWTELNASKTKMRFQLEKTFEVSKRLATWNSRSRQTFNSTQGRVQHGYEQGASNKYDDL